MARKKTSDFKKPSDHDDEHEHPQQSQSANPGQTRKVSADLLEQALIDARNAARKKPPFQDDVDEPATVVEQKPPVSDTIVDRINEADFYLEQALLTDAKFVLDDVVKKAPDHTAANAKLAAIEQMQAEGSPESPEGPAKGSDKGDLKRTGKSQASLSFSKSKESSLPEYSPESHPSMEKSDVHLLAGIAHMQAKRFDQAIVELTKALDWKHNEMICHLLIGSCYFQKGTPVKAIKHFKIGLHIEDMTQNETTPFYYELGKTYEFLHDSDEAIYYYSKVAKIHPDYSEIQKKIDSLKLANDQSVP